MYLLEKRPGPKGVVRYREVSAILDVRYKVVLMYEDRSGHDISQYYLYPLRIKRISGILAGFH